MKKYIGCDAHRRYSVFVSVEENGKASKATRVEHEGAAVREYLASLPAGVDIAVEATGSWDWLVDAIEQAGKTPHLAQAFAARRMLGGDNKTDEIDARAWARLLRNGAVPVECAAASDRLQESCHRGDPSLWIARGPGRPGSISRQGRVRLSVYTGRLPDHTREATTREWQIIDELEQHEAVFVIAKPGAKKLMPDLRANR